jgi:hypothetical protein
MIETPLEQAATYLNVKLKSHRTAYLSAASFLCLLTFSGYSHAKAPWMDEVLTVTIARQPALSDIWKGVNAGFEADPPFFEIIVHYLFRVFGDHIFLARLPAILGFCLTCVCLSLLVWRHTPAVYGAATFFLPFATALRIRAMDARPYGMMMGFSALTLLCWDALGDEELRYRTAWRVAFTLSLAIALFSHFFSIWLLLGLGTGELCRWIIRRRIDWRTPACAAAAMIPYILSVPVLLSGSRIFEVREGHFHGHLAFRDLYEFFGQQISGLPFAGVLLLLFAAYAMGGGSDTAVRWKALSPRHRELLAAAAGFLLVPIAGYLGGVLVTKFFIGYYFAIAAFGVVLGVPLLLAAFQSPGRVAGLCLFLAVSGHGMFVAARGITGFARRDRPFPDLKALQALMPEPQADLVITSPAQFFPFYEVTHADRLVYLFDRKKALDQIGTNTSEIIYCQLRPFTPARIEPFDAYSSGRASYYVAVFDHGTGLDDWQFNYLLTHETRFSWLGKVDGVDLFRVQPAVVPASK